MKWSEFSDKVNALLAVERRRLGAQPFIDQQIRLAVGDVQRLLDYYRRGMVTTIEVDGLTRDGFSSKGKLPAGANLREAYHVKTGTMWARRPLNDYPFSNRNDLRAGVVNIESGRFLIAIDHREKDFWVYPRVTKGYAVQVVWDAIVGRGNVEYDANDEVPFDEPVVQLVYDYVKMRLCKEVDRDMRSAVEYERSYRQGIASLFAETQERLRFKHDISDASCVPSPTCGGACSQCGCTPCGCTTSIYTNGYCDSCPTIELPQVEWVMVGDSGERLTIGDTIEVANAVSALDPQFVVHLGDAAYPSAYLPGGTGTPKPGPYSYGGSAHLIRDLYLRHYWSFLDANLYHTFGNHDLETEYGGQMLDALSQTNTLIGSANRSLNRLWYEFARGPVRFFVMNSGLNETDENLGADHQINWIKQRIPLISEPWIIVCFHRPAYTSDSAHAPGSTVMRGITDQLREIGVDLVVCGHAHSYERLVDSTGLMHVICGTGGITLRGVTSNDNLRPTGSQFFYNDKHGFLRFTATSDELEFQMITVDGEVVDEVMLRKTSDRIDTGGVIPEGIAPYIVENPIPRIAVAGQPASFTVVAAGDAPLEYQWQRDGVDIYGANTSTYTLDPVLPIDDGAQFRCVVTNSSGTATSAYAAVVIYQQGGGGSFADFATIPDAQAAVITATFVAIASDINGEPAFFRVEPGYTVITEGADGFTDLASTVFKRFQSQ